MTATVHAHLHVHMHTYGALFAACLLQITIAPRAPVTGVLPTGRIRCAGENNVVIASSQQTQRWCKSTSNRCAANRSNKMTCLAGNPHLAGTQTHVVKPGDLHDLHGRHPTPCRHTSSAHANGPSQPCARATTCLHCCCLCRCCYWMPPCLW